MYFLVTCTSSQFITEPVELFGEGQYYLHALKEIKVTDSYLGLSKQCQNEEPLSNCTTRQYRNTMLGKCGCLPLAIRTGNKVWKNYCYDYLISKLITLNLKQFRSLLAPLQMILIVWTVSMLTLLPAEDLALVLWPLASIKFKNLKSWKICFQF